MLPNVVDRFRSWISDVLPMPSKVLAEIRRIEERHDAMYRQLADVVEQAGGLIPPPRHLQERVVGTFSPQFISSGQTIVANVRAMLRRVDRDLSSFANVLDFGCGCGRVTRTFYYHLTKQQRLFGTDIDPEAIDWCRAHYASVATFDCNPHMPPTRYEDATFDLIYSGSVFTHLPEAMQWAWLEELRRITKPGAYLALTFHGVHYHGRLEGPMKVEFDRAGFVYGKFGVTPGLPDFYETTWHSHDYIRKRWSDFFDIVHIEPRGLEGMQDIALCRRQ